MKVTPIDLPQVSDRGTDPTPTGVDDTAPTGVDDQAVIQSSALVSVQNPQDNKAVDSIDALPRVYYVIVGCGPAAVINHTTLRQSKYGRERIGNLHVMHIGFPDPWTSYMEHGMGQPKHLLSLPGFRKQPTGGGERDGGLISKYFADCVDNELSLLKSDNHGVSIKKGWVAWIQRQGEESNVPTENLFENEENGKAVFKDVLKAAEKPYPKFASKKVAPYRLIVYVPTKEKRRAEIVYAAYIDICTGPGRPLVIKMDNESKEYAAARTAPWLAPDIWADLKRDDLPKRLLLNGVDAIRNEVPWVEKERVCVTAGGGVGLNAAEKARNHRCLLDWFGRSGLRKPAFENPRNVTFLLRKDSTTEGEVMQPGEPLVLEADEAELRPPFLNLRYGMGAVLTAAAYKDDKVDVTLAANGKINQIRHFGGEISGLHKDGDKWDMSKSFMEKFAIEPARIYDRLVIPNGQGPKEFGQAEYLVQGAGVIVAQSSGGSPDGRMTMLRSKGGRVRVLGAAAQTYTGFGFDPNSKTGQRGDSANAKMWDYRDVLPVSAVPDGFILSGLNIAAANRYFVDNPNKNVNTMTGDEMKALLEKSVDAIQAEEIQKAIMKERNPKNGFKNFEDLKKAVPTAPDIFKYGY